MADVRSEMAASVFRIEVAVGDTVAQGDALVTLESMKMEIPVLAGIDGNVSEILVSEGDVIDEGAIVARVSAS